MKRHLVGITFPLLCVAAQAAPVYLECSSLNKHSGKTTKHSIALDESAGTATFSDDGLTLGKTYTRPAQFTQTEVKYSWVMSGLGFTAHYRIDRTNMELSQIFMGNQEKTDAGSCKIAQPVDRKF